MKSKELIALLQQADPSGEIEVAVENRDIYFLELQPAYWDGRLQRLIIDDAKKPYYSVVGAKVIAHGLKLTMHIMGVEDVINNDPDAPVDLSELESSSQEDWKQRIEKWRAESKED